MRRLGCVVGMVGAGEREIPQCSELCLDPVSARTHNAGVASSTLLWVTQSRICVVVGVEVVKDEVQPHRRAGRARQTRRRTPHMW